MRGGQTQQHGRGQLQKHKEHGVVHHEVRIVNFKTRLQPVGKTVDKLQI
jgi:hypothetical protein